MKITDFDILDEEVSPEEINVSSLILKKTLNPLIWSGWDLCEDVRIEASHIANSYIKYMFRDIGKVNVIDVIFTGSLCNFNWSSYSDFDIHVVVDFKEISEDTELVDNYIYDRSLLYRTKNKIKIKGFEVELNTNQPETLKKDVGAYSLKNNKWLQKPNIAKISIDYNEVKRKASQLMNLIDNNLEDLECLTLLKQKIRNMRQTALDSEGEFAIENLAFKLLRRANYIEKLNNAINKLES